VCIYEDEPGWRSAAKLLTRDDARRIAANVAPELLGIKGKRPNQCPAVWRIN
jgi:hypothetical protein